MELTGDKATGVNFIFEDSHHTVKVNREVVVSCGALQTPQILELSGIGDPEILRKAGVECKVENKAVGHNFMDHSITLIPWELKEGHHSLDAIHTPAVMEGAQKEYMETQGGPLSCISSMQGFFPYKLFATDAEQKEVEKSVEDAMTKLTPFQKKQYVSRRMGSAVPPPRLIWTQANLCFPLHRFECTLAHLKDDKSANLQLVLVAATADTEHGVEDQSRLFVPPATAESPHQITGAMCLEYPLSRGTVHIKSSDPTQHPAVDPVRFSLF